LNTQVLLRTISGRRIAVLQALFVTFLWSTSWVLIKMGIDQIPALTFAGLRYMMAFICLLPFMLHPTQRSALASLNARDWGWLFLLGLLVITITQGAQFFGLAYLPAVTVSLALNFTSPLVAILGILFLRERPTLFQWGGLVIFLAGVAIYFYPVNFPAGQWLALGVVSLGVISNALSSVLGRALNRKGHIPALTVTAVSIGIGSTLLLAAGLLTQGLPSLGLREWVIIVWMAVVNTAFAFTLWNHTLRTLPAMESSIINGTMLIQIALLAWIFLGETLTLKTGLALLAAGAGAFLVQWRGRMDDQRRPV